jgi:hypothetical protein
MIIWEGTLALASRGKGTPTKARLVSKPGAMLDKTREVGPGMRVEMYDQEEDQWNSVSPDYFSPTSLFLALAEVSERLDALRFEE